MVEPQNRQSVRAVATREGAGVTVHRTLGTAALKNLDPFLLLDHFSSDDPDEYIAGFPDHPHRGFITFTYMLDGHLRHRDSMGNTGDLQAGGAQWMKAASGVIHSEMPQQVNGLLRGFQLWINLPAAHKLDDPAYQEFAADAFPVIEQAGASVKLLLGDYAGRQAPISDPFTRVLFLDIGLAPAARFELPLDDAVQGFVYIFEGVADLAGQALAAHSLAVLAPGERVRLQAGATAARLVLVAGRPLREPVVQYGPFVMNTREEIDQAFADYRAGTLVRSRASVTGQAPGDGQGAER